MDLDGNVRMTLDCPADRVGLNSISQVITFALCLQEARDGLETRPSLISVKTRGFEIKPDEHHHDTNQESAGNRPTSQKSSSKEKQPKQGSASGSSPSQRSFAPFGKSRSARADLSTASSGNILAARPRGAAAGADHVPHHGGCRIPCAHRGCARNHTRTWLCTSMACGRCARDRASRREVSACSPPRV